MNKPALIVLLTCAVAFVSCSPRGMADGPDLPQPVFVSEDPQSIYAADLNDPWNRIFRELFTRTVNSVRPNRQKISRTELGDRAIEPFYPTFFTAEGVAQVLSEPRFTELTTALQQSLDEQKNRSPIERALMQADVWAAHDVIFRATKINPERAARLLSLLRQFIRKLALTTDEIKSLTNNYVLAAGANKLPRLFSVETGWLEIELEPHRLHDDAASYRRAARVFVKPRTPPADPAQFVESLKHNQHHDKVEAVALAVQNLLFDTSGRVVPAPLFTDVQFRFFKNDPKTGATSAHAQRFELSRRKLLTDPTSGGFVEYAETSPAYLSAAGNDYGFATPIDNAGAPIMVPLRTRCAQCHNSSLTTIMTYAVHDFPPVPTTRILKLLDQERALYVAQRKQERDDFKALSTAR